MLFFKKQTTKTQTFKRKARRNLTSNFSREKKNYVVDTSAIINKFVSRLIRKGLSGKVIIPNAVMAELENIANKGREEGFVGLEEIAGFHKLKNNYPVQIYFEGTRPNEMQIKFAKSGEIDAVIRDVAIKTKSILITADLVQAKTAQAYDIPVIFLRPKLIKEKKGFWLWKK